VIWLAALLAGGGLAALGLALAPVLPMPASRATMADRISTFGVESLARPLDDETAGTFYERIVQPQVDRARQFVERNTPDAMQADLDSKLELAGRPYGITAADFLVLRAAAAIGGLTVGLAAGWAASSVVVAAVLALLLGGGGWFAPGFWINRQVTARRQEILLALPPVLDLLVVAVDAGLSFDLALGRVVDKLHNPLTAELDQVQRQISLGRSRAEALESLVKRVNVEDVQRLVNALMQADELGVPIARALRDQAAEARRLARQRAQQAAATATVKMVVPMILFILPTVWLILLGPAIVSLFVHGL
jgi:tight adherence protein C